MTSAIEPRTASAVTREFFRCLERSSVSLPEVSRRSGPHLNTFYGWRSGKASATVPNLEAALAVLGLELCIRPINSNQETIP